MAKAKKVVDVKAELLEATSIKPRKNESLEDLSARVATYISQKMSEEDYEGVSKAAKKWYEEYCAASEAEEDLPTMPTPEVAEEEEAPPKKAAAKKARKGGRS